MTNALELLVRPILRNLEPTCKFWKLPTDLRLVGSGEDMTLAHGEPMPSDFMGWDAAGKTVLIECKDVDRDRLPLGTKGSNGLSPFQMQAALLAHRTGSVRYFAIWKRGERFVIFNPARFEKSFPWTDGDGSSPLEVLEDHLRALILYG